MIPRWMELAQSKIGQHEVTGAEANPFIVECFARTTLGGSKLGQSDETPWCSAFVCWCMESAGIPSTRSAAAASWQTWGVPVLEPYPVGAVIVLGHAGPDAATGSPSGSHVALFQSRDLAHIQLLGGNQSDCVKSSLFPLDQYKIVAARWPQGVQL